jgi:hypothetical protein
MAQENTAKNGRIYSLFVLMLPQLSAAAEQAGGW